MSGDECVDVGLPVKLFMDSETGAISEVRVMVPHSRTLVCDCGEGSEDDPCVHQFITATEITANGGIFLLGELSEEDDEDLEALGDELDLTDADQIARFRELVLRRTRIEVLDAGE